MDTSNIRRLNDRFGADGGLGGHELASAMLNEAESAASLLKSLSHGGRLMILCHLASGEKSVSELEARLGSRQAAVSQQLARLRLDGLVKPRRDGKAIYYSLSDARAQRIVAAVVDLFSPSAA